MTKKTERKFKKNCFSDSLSTQVTHDINLNINLDFFSVHLRLTWRNVLKNWNLKCLFTYSQEHLPWFGMIYDGMSASFQYCVKEQHVKCILGKTLLSQHYGFLTNCNSVITVLPLRIWRFFVNNFLLYWIFMKTLTLASERKVTLHAVSCINYNVNYLYFA